MVVLRLKDGLYFTFHHVSNFETIGDDLFFSYLRCGLETEAFFHLKDISYFTFVSDDV